MKYGKWLGIGVTTLGLLASASVMAHGAKIKWDKNGKPIIEKSKKPIKGCKQDLSFLDSNKTLTEDYNPTDMFKPKKKGCK